jgi:hypothetical protein
MVPGIASGGLNVTSTATHSSCSLGMVVLCQTVHVVALAMILGGLDSLGLHKIGWMGWRNSGGRIEGKE